jgi:hypothetical protein
MLSISSDGSFNLPGGYLDGNGCHREAVLRPLRGSDEDWILSLPHTVPEPVAVTELLSRCVKRIGSLRATRDLLRRLSIGDRDFLMLQLRRMTFGAKAEVVLTCPNPGCNEKMDAAFTLDEIPVQTREPQATYRAGTAEFRLPQGADQESLAQQPQQDYKEMVGELLALCLVNVSRNDALRLTDSSIAVIETAMEEASPSVHLELTATCTGCGETFDASFDPVSFFLNELRERGTHFEREVHLLSFYYHWPLRDILMMSHEQRHRYLRCLLNELSMHSEETT